MLVPRMVFLMDHFVRITLTESSHGSDPVVDHKKIGEIPDSWHLPCNYVLKTHPARNKSDLWEA